MPHWSLNRPAGSAALMVACAAERFGLPTETCLAGSGLRAEDLADPVREITGQRELVVLRNILRALGPDVPFGLEAGLRYRATTHGAWGLMLLTSPSLAEALEAMQPYNDLTYSFNRLGHELDERELRFLYDSSDNPEDLRAALVERDLGALLTLERDILGELIPIESLQLCARRPSYAATFETLFGCTPEWNAPRNCLTMAASCLSASSPLADRLAMRACEDQCQKLLAERIAHAGLVGSVRARLLRGGGPFPEMGVVAAELGISPRTLRNRLGEEGTSFRQLVNDSRRALAEELLTTTELSVQEIAERLGYADTSSFTTAFRRWTGVPPHRYREAAYRAGA